jgi:hypothetical protein
MKNLVLITSIINTPNIQLSYGVRSVFTSEERFQQTKKTISSVKEKIPNCKILIVECSKLTDEQNNYFNTNCDFFLNLIENKEAVNNIYSISKSLGEGTMTIHALEYLSQKTIYFDNFFKISGRYWLSDNFNFKNFNDDKTVIHYIDGNINNVCTSLYKLHKNNINNFYEFLTSKIDLMNSCIGYEILFAMFLNFNIHRSDIIHLNKIGVNGYISVSNDYIDN